MSPSQPCEAHYFMEGSNVVPGLWSSADAEVLVLSANLPLMRPLFRRCGNALGLYSHNLRAMRDEDTSNILELSPSTDQCRRKPNCTATCHSDRLRTATAKARLDDRGEPGFRDDLPENRIMVELDLEQNVHELGVGTLASSTTSL